jgi:hypothetical protein
MREGNNDIAVRGPDGREALVVEVKARRGLDRRWATQLHRNLQAHGFTADARYFLLVTPDETYLWSERPSTGQATSPDAVVPTESLLDPDLLSAASTDGQALELLVSAWISSLIGAPAASDVPAAARRIVVDSGLFEALRDGAVLTEAA